MSENPYSSPISDVKGDKVAESPQGLNEIARATFLAWEKLRLAYVGILGLWTLFLTWGHLSDREVLIQIMVGGFVANVLYFAAPVLETYVRWLGYKGNWLRIILFVTGTLITMVLALSTFAILLIPPQP